MERQHSAFATLVHDKRCFTKPSQPVQVVLWGDSHANHWFPLMHAASRELDTNVEEFSRAACPPLLGVMPFLEGAVDHQCERFNQAVVAEIESLAHAGLKGVVLAGRWPAYIGQPSPDGSLLARLSYGESALDAAQSEAALHLGLSMCWIVWSAPVCESWSSVRLLSSTIPCRSACCAGHCRPVRCRARLSTRGAGAR
jgi:hypothetical protein